MRSSGSSSYRGVTQHKWTGRYEAHLWDSSSARVTNTKGRTKGKQVYLGGYESETTAAKAYDRVSEQYPAPALRPCIDWAST